MSESITKASEACHSNKFISNKKENRPNILFSARKDSVHSRGYNVSTEAMFMIHTSQQVHLNPSCHVIIELRIFMNPKGVDSNSMLYLKSL